MSNDRFASAHEMVREYAELEAKMADPSIHEDQANARKLGRRYAQLGPVVAGFKAWKSSEDDLLAAAELADVDPDFAAEIPALEAARDAAAEKLEELLLPRDPNDDRDVILEVKAGAGLTTRTLAATGGQESISQVPPHTHTITDPSHTHSYVNNVNNQNTDNAFATQTAADDADIAQTTGASFTGITINNTGTNIAGGNVDVMNPFLVLNYIIKV